MKSRQIDKDWDLLFCRHNVLDSIRLNGFFTISSKQINKVHEARLMTKFDNRENLPEIFKQHNLSILPVTRGNYIIGSFDAYENMKYETKRYSPFSMPEYIESINTNDLYSESACLNCAYSSGIIDDLCGSRTLPTVSGRMSSNAFDFKIINSLGDKYFDIDVQNSQIEIDGGYESKDQLIIIEAKNYSVNDFLIRQLYYPYRLWTSKIKKHVIPVFMTCSNDIFSFFVFEFQDPFVYNSIRLIKQKNYIIAPEPITLGDIHNVMMSTEIKEEPEIPFPQCDNFARIVDLLGLLADKKELTPEEITGNYAFVPRQTDYYVNGAKYLGLIDKCVNDESETVWTLTELGRKIMAKHHKQKNICIVSQILAHKIFNEVLHRYFAKHAPVMNSEICDIMKTYNVYHVGAESTLKRRAQTVAKWIDWILNLITI